MHSTIQSILNMKEQSLHLVKALPEYIQRQTCLHQETKQGACT